MNEFYYHKLTSYTRLPRTWFLEVGVSDTDLRVPAWRWTSLACSVSANHCNCRGNLEKSLHFFNFLCTPFLFSKKNSGQNIQRIIDMNYRKVSVSPTSFFPKQSAWCLVVNCIFVMQLRIKLHSSWDLKVHIGTVLFFSQGHKNHLTFFSCENLIPQRNPQNNKGCEMREIIWRTWVLRMRIDGWLRWLLPWDQVMGSEFSSNPGTFCLCVCVSFLQFFGKFMFWIAMLFFFFKGQEKSREKRQVLLVP